MKADNKDLIVGVDIGTSKVVVAVAEVLTDGRFQLIGLGQADSEGLRKGVEFLQGIILREPKGEVTWA